MTRIELELRVSDESKYSPELLRERLAGVREKIDGAKKRRDVEGDVALIGVTKTHPPEAIRVLYEAGLRAFGASYVQEWEAKYPQLPDDIDWHFVGRLQSNKAKYIADRVIMVHSVDRKSVMKSLHRRCEEPVDILLQVNLGMEASKGGVPSDEIEALMERTLNYPRLRVRGLMGMPPYRDDPEDNRHHFRALRETLERLRDTVEERDPYRAKLLTELSMGMSNDYEVAIEEGATIIRLGTALFGPRSYDG